MKKMKKFVRLRASLLVFDCQNEQQTLAILAAAAPSPLLPRNQPSHPLNWHKKHFAIAEIYSAKFAKLLGTTKLTEFPAETAK